MKRILALDMAGHTGWAYQSADGAIHSGMTPFLSSTDPGARWLRFELWLESWGEMKPGPALIVYEEPITHFANRRGLGFGYGFEAILRLHATKKEIRCLSVLPTVLKKWATGKGNADKWLMVRFARQIKADVSDDNEADAILLLEYAKEKLKRAAGKCHRDTVGQVIHKLTRAGLIEKGSGGAFSLRQT